MLGDAGLTVAWQEPVSALYAQIVQGRLGDDLRRPRARAAERASTSPRCARWTPSARGWRSSRGRCAATPSAATPSGASASRASARASSIVDGTDAASLRKGPGIYDDAPFPGAPGTVAIAGHRTTYLAPFRRDRQAAPRRRDRRRDALRPLHLPRAADARSSRRPRSRSSSAWATTGSCCRPATRSTARPSGSSSSPASSRAEPRGAALTRRDAATRHLRTARARALKREAAALDSCRAMRTQELKLRIQRADYVVDPVAVAEAMLRHALSQRRWWNPVAACATPPAQQHDAPAGPRRPTRPTSAAPRPRPPRGPPGRRRRTARSPRRPPAASSHAGTPSCARDVGDAVGERQRVEVDLDARRRSARARCPASEARPSERSIIACAPARASARPSRQARLGPQVAARERVGPVARGRRGSPGRRRTRRACPVTPTRSPGRAPPRRTSCGLVVGPADDGDRERQHRRRRDVAADERDAAALGERSPSRRRARARRPRRSPAGMPSTTYASPGSAPIAARSDSAPASARWPASAALAVAPRRKCTPSTIASVDVTRQRARAHDGGVVAAADEHPLGRRAEALAHRGDEVELVHRGGATAGAGYLWR